MDWKPTYGTQEEIVKLAMKKNLEYPDKYCPLADALCRPDCVCWLKAYAYNQGTDRYVLLGHHCNNSMFTNE